MYTELSRHLLYHYQATLQVMYIHVCKEKERIDNQTSDTTAVLEHLSLCQFHLSAAFPIVKFQYRRGHLIRAYVTIKIGWLIMTLMHVNKKDLMK